MKGKNINFLLLIILLVSSFWLSAQDFNWHCNKNIYFQKDKDLLAAIQHYDKKGRISENILLVDYVPNNDTSIFFILGDMDMFALFYKKPDCYCLYNQNIIYLYTPSYTQPKDTLWLQQLFDLTRVTLREIIGEIQISWANDSILTKEINTLFGSFCYDPLYIEYHVYNGNIIKTLFHEMKGYFYEMLYPDTGYPKGIYNKYDAIKFYESQPNKEDYWKWQKK